VTTVTSQPSFLPYGRQHLEEDDIQAVIDVLRSDWWTQGEMVPAFERQLADCVGAADAIACSSGTAALHLSMLALGVGLGDVVLTSANSFLASANCARFVGADVRFVDIDPATGLLDLDSLAETLAADHDRRIKAVIPVHFAGQPVDLPTLRNLTDRHGASVISDACHALGATYDHEGTALAVGSGDQHDAAVFSFHPVKHVATGEGGAITTDDPVLAERLRRFRSHGMQKDSFVDTAMATAPSGDTNPWYYEMQQLGYNYRLTDIQAALGASQLTRLDWSLKQRNELASCYRRLIAESFDDSEVHPLVERPGMYHAYHLFVVQIAFEHFGIDRATVMRRLRQAGIGSQVHYIPINLQPYYRKLYGGRPGDLPCTDGYYARALSLPMYPDLNQTDCERIIDKLHRVLNRENE
jgi:UDP-4-amino-4,6-dideoxy-N-acetyl-beta-L-altrosamine transaminase